MKTDINDITVDDFREALETVLNGKVTTIAPLGFSSDRIYLYHNKTDGVSWSGCVTLRTWSNMPELLIGNKAGKWLCHMQIDRIMGFDYILNEFYRAFENVKHMIDKSNSHKHKAVIDENVRVTPSIEVMERLVR